MKEIHHYKSKCSQLEISVKNSEGHQHLIHEYELTINHLNADIDGHKRALEEWKGKHSKLEISIYELRVI